MPADAAIEVRDLQKTFRIPRHRVSTLKEKALHPFRRQQFDERHVLRGVDFEIARGEFFGIVGRNGSGKSTLLKCLAGIYETDAGSIGVAGRLSPFIELGVGFNPELTARENVVINAVMMGLSPREARGRFDAVMAFAELEPFVDLRLKNYSSGMQVRLAFSVMVQTDADVMLIDEVLAVGDAAFQQKCFDVFYRLREEGKTIVLVTHEMGLIERFCHRAMHLSDGEIVIEGDPVEVGRSYLAENFGGHVDDAGFHSAGADDAVLLDLWVADEDSRRADSVAHGLPMELHAEIEARAAIESPGLALWVEDAGGTRIFSIGIREEDGSGLRDLGPGERLAVSARLHNRLASGRYHVGLSLTRGSTGSDIVLVAPRAKDVLVWGGEAVHGIVAVDHRLSVEHAGAEVLSR